MRVPLILSGPGILPGTRPEQVAHSDLMPTLLELTGAPSPPGLVGSSLLQALPALRYHYAETALEKSPGEWTELERELSSVRSGPWKLIRDEGSGELQLFHTDEDPFEQRNRYPAAEAPLNELVLALDERRAAAVEPTPFSEPDREALQSALRELGYLS